METKEIEVLNEKYYYEQLSNGLKVYLFPNKNETNYEINMLTPYGSKVTNFRKKGAKKYITVPQGTAHFLEHQLFEREDGTNLMELFDNLSLNSNAGTGINYTEYYVSGRKNFKKALNILLDNIQKPYFSDAGTEKEKGIIIEERRQRDNNPNFCLLFTELEMIFHNDNERYSGLGTKDDIESITTQNLIDFYKHFYHPSKMYLIISGNFNYQEAIKIIKDNQNSKHFEESFDVEIKDFNEPRNVNESLKKINLAFEKPRFRLAYKIDRNLFNQISESIIEVKDYLYYILDNNFGPTAEFADNLLKSGLTNNRISTNVVINENYILIRIGAMTEKHEELKKIIEEKMNNLEIDEQSFNRYKKNMISDFIFESQNKILYADILVYYITKGYEFPNNYLNVVKNMSYDNVDKIINCLDLSQKSILFVYPNKQNN